VKDVYTIEDLRDWPGVTAGEKPPLRLAVFGDPVAHSASPPMHNAALEVTGMKPATVACTSAPRSWRKHFSCCQSTASSV
jgi:shikimate 5-dehydrogenase